MHTMRSIFITGAASGIDLCARLIHARGWRVGRSTAISDGLDSLTRELGTERVWTRVLSVTWRVPVTEPTPF